MLNCGPKPRTVTCEPAPLRRLIDTPVMRCSDAARLVSGNLPMSSALIASTTPIALRLIFIDCSRLLRIPVTTTVLRLVADCCALSCELPCDWPEAAALAAGVGCAADGAFCA